METVGAEIVPYPHMHGPFVAHSAFACAGSIHGFNLHLQQRRAVVVAALLPEPGDVRSKQRRVWRKHIEVHPLEGDELAVRGESLLGLLGDDVLEARSGAVRLLRTRVIGWDGTRCLMSEKR